MDRKEATSKTIGIVKEKQKSINEELEEAKGLYEEFHVTLPKGTSVKEYLNNKKYGPVLNGEKEAKRIALEWKLRDFLNEGILKEKEEEESEFDKFDVYSDEDLETYEPEPQKWLIEHQIPKGIGLLVGKRGEYKTFITMAQAYALASGKDCFNDKVPEKKKILFIEEENGKDEIAKRRNLIKKGMEIKGSVDIKFVSYSGLKLNLIDDDMYENKKFKQFRKLVSEYKPDLIIVDCFSRFVTFNPDTDNAEISKFLTEVANQFTRVYGCNWLFLHHLRKSPTGPKRSSDDLLDEVRGGSELVNYARYVLSCQVPKFQNDDGSTMVVFKVLKMSNAPIPPAKVISFTNEGDKLLIKYEGEPQDVLAGEVQCGNAIKEYLFTKQILKFETKEINKAAEEIGFKKTLINSGLKYLWEQGILEKIKRGHWEVKGGDRSQEKLE